MRRLTIVNLRAILRREQTNMEKKVTLVLMIVNMYRLLVPDFYPMCVQAVVQESCFTVARQTQVHAQLIELLSQVDWKRKRFLPNAKEVIVKIAQL
jgi:hypothetical protein